MNRSALPPITLAAVTGLHVAALFALSSMREQPVTPPVPQAMEMVSLPSPLPMAPPKPVPQAAPAKPVVQPKAAPKPTPPRQVVERTPRSVTAPSTQPDTTAPASPAAQPADGPSAAAATPAGNGSPKAEARELPVTPPLHAGGYLDNPRPPYPALSMEAGESGKVLLSVHVTADGRAESVSVVRSSGFPRLDRSARETVQRWRFIPAKRGNEPIPYTYNVPIDFSLRSSS